MKNVFMYHLHFLVLINITLVIATLQLRATNTLRTTLRCCRILVNMHAVGTACAVIDL